MAGARPLPSRLDASSLVVFGALARWDKLCPKCRDEHPAPLDPTDEVNVELVYPKGDSDTHGAVDLVNDDAVRIQLDLGEELDFEGPTEADAKEPTKTPYARWLKRRHHAQAGTRRQQSATVKAELRARRLHHSKLALAQSAIMRGATVEGARSFDHDGTPCERVVFDTLGKPALGLLPRLCRDMYSGVSSFVMLRAFHYVGNAWDHLASSLGATPKAPVGRARTPKLEDGVVVYAHCGTTAYGLTVRAKLVVGRDNRRSVMLRELKNRVYTDRSTRHTVLQAADGDNKLLAGTAEGAVALFDTGAPYVAERHRTGWGDSHGFDTRPTAAPQVRMMWRWARFGLQSLGWLLQVVYDLAVCARFATNYSYIVSCGGLGLWGSLSPRDTEQVLICILLVYIGASAMAHWMCIKGRSAGWQWTVAVIGGIVAFAAGVSAAIVPADGPGRSTWAYWAAIVVFLLVGMTASSAPSRPRSRPTVGAGFDAAIPPRLPVQRLADAAGPLFCWIFIWATVAWMMDARVHRKDDVQNDWWHTFAKYPFLDNAVPDAVEALPETGVYIVSVLCGVFAVLYLFSPTVFHVLRKRQLLTNSKVYGALAAAVQFCARQVSTTLLLPIAVMFSYQLMRGGAGDIAPVVDPKFNASCFIPCPNITCAGPEYGFDPVDDPNRLVLGGRIGPLQAVLWIIAYVTLFYRAATLVAVRCSLSRAPDFGDVRKLIRFGSVVRDSFEHVQREAPLSAWQHCMSRRSSWLGPAQFVSRGMMFIALMCANSSGPFARAVAFFAALIPVLLVARARPCFSTFGNKYEYVRAAIPMYLYSMLWFYPMRRYLARLHLGWEHPVFDEWWDLLVEVVVLRFLYKGYMLASHEQTRLDMIHRVSWAVLFNWLVVPFCEPQSAVQWWIGAGGVVVRLWRSAWTRCTRGAGHDGTRQRRVGPHSS